VNVRILEKGRPVPEGAPPSPTPIAEEALNRFPGVREHYAERDVLAALENVPVIITIAARAGWAALAQDISDATETGRALLADWWRHGWTETFQRPAFWAGPVTPPDPAAHPYPVPAPVAEPEHVCEACGVAVTGGEIGPEGLHWLCEDHRSEPDEDGCPACGGTRSERFYVAGLSGPVTCSDDWHDGDAAEPGRPAPVAEPVRDPEEDAPAGRAVEDDAPAPATDPVTVLRALAEKQDAAMEPEDAAKATEPAPVAEPLSGPAMRALAEGRIGPYPPRKPTVRPESDYEMTLPEPPAAEAIEPAKAETEAMPAQDGSDEGGGSDA
jgi:hypothetical protein